MPIQQTADDRVSDAQAEIEALLAKWATAEPQRCRKVDGQFEALYFGNWLKVDAARAHHGNIIAAVLDACHANSIYCEIEYTPRYEKQPPSIEVGCIPKMFRWDEGDEVIASIPELLLTEYLERVDKRPLN
ncbi:MAG: hypothetical protein HYR56_17755 [Acidobacteria bacterium]|nr:hypothetical protein [Acidobacteriota bacterium]MBI3424064.1 hypothetical protein [Acidobacteriota bacterium]